MQEKPFTALKGTRTLMKVFRKNLSQPMRSRRYS